MSTRSRAVLVWGWLALCAVGCGGGVTPTPVTAAPLAADKLAELRTMLVGSWRLVDEQPLGGQRRKAEDTTTMTFSANGAMSYRYARGVSLMSWGANVGKTYQWRLDGANLSFAPQFMVLRVDRWTETTLDVFMYDLSYHWYFERLPEKPHT